MLKVLIVEDEILTRIGLESMIRWEENGFTVVGIAKNGKEGLEIAIDFKPDIIITDVMMPKMNGIELMKALKNTDVSPKFIVLSGYNEYSYVREALKLGAVDYLLKLDIEPELLLNTLMKIKKSISIYPETEGTSISWNDQTTVICKLLQGKLVPRETIEQELASSKIEFPSKNFVLITTRDSSNTEKIMQEVFYPDPGTILRTINELLTNFGVTYGCVVRNIYFFNILCPNKPLDFEDLQYLKKEITASLSDYFYKIYNIGVTIHISQLLHSFFSLQEEYLKSFDTIFSDSPDAYRVKSTKLSDSFSQVVKSVKENNLAGIDGDFSNLIDAMQKDGDVSQSEMFGLCNLIIQELDSQLTEQKKYLITWNIEELKMTLKSCQDQSDFIRFLSYCRKKTSLYSDERDYTDNTLENAMKWIECNYKDPNLNLNEIASQVNVSPNHLCKVFSKKLNISPMKYVMKVRISKAKKYLRTTDKQIKEIADLTGFNYSYYFSRTFKKITGLTPLEYRQG